MKPRLVWGWSVPGTTETNVRVRIGRGVVQIQRERAIIRAIVPIAATLEGAAASSAYP